MEGEQPTNSTYSDDENKSRKRMKAYYIDQLRLIEANLTSTDLECKPIHSKEMKNLPQDLKTIKQLRKEFS